MSIELVMPSNHLILYYPQHQGLFKWVSSSHQVAKVLEFQPQHQSFQWIFMADFLLDGLVGSPCSPRDSQESYPTPWFKSINSSSSSFFILQLSYPYMTTANTKALTRWNFIGKVMSLLFNMLSRFVIAFLPRSKHFLKEFIHSVNIFNCVLGTNHVLNNIVTKTQMLSDFMGFLV